MNSYLKFPIILIPNAGTITRPTSLRKTLESDLFNKSNLPEIKPINTKPKRGLSRKINYKTLTF